MPLTVRFAGLFIGMAIPGERWLWSVHEPFQLHWQQGEKEGVVNIPKHFVTDFASVPRLLWNLLPPTDGQVRSAAIAHDVGYVTNEYPRAFCDALLFAGCRALGAPWWKSWLIYCAVRLAGGRAYRTGFMRQVENAEQFQLRFAPVPVGSITICDPVLGYVVYDPLRNQVPPDYVTWEDPAHASKL